MDRMPELTAEERQALIDAAKRDQERQLKIEKRKRAPNRGTEDEKYFGID